MLPYDEIEMWHGHLDVYINILEKILNTLDDRDFGFFVEVNLNYSNNIKEKTNNFSFGPEKQICKKIIFSDYVKKTKPDTQLYTI